MKKALSLALTLCLIFTFSISVYAEGGTDATSSASTSYTAPGATGTVVKVTVPAGAVAYTVKSGDVMWKIAKDNGLTLDQLLKLNPWIKNGNAIKVGQQLLVKAAPATAVVPVVPVVSLTERYLGLGNMNNFRVRGANYSMNMTTASVIFDKDGKIVSAYVDTYEVGQAAGFTNWPGATPETTIETATAQVSAWKSKREVGDAYGMAKAATTKNEWYVQMDYYQKFFVGKTVAELRTWFNKNTGATGKPINPATTTVDAEKAKLALLTDAEKANLADVVTSATMSLSDSHSLILEAIEEAYAKRVLIK